VIIPDLNPIAIFQPKETVRYKMDSTRHKIIDATIKCIGTHGIHAVTNRLIAKIAHVNIAAINYHFGSQEKLINEAIKYSLDTYLTEIFNVSLDKEESTDSQLILKRLLSESLSDAISSPQMLKSFLYDSLLHGEYNGVFIEKLNDFLKRIYDHTDISVSAKSTEKIKLSIVQMVSSILFIGLLPKFFKGFLGFDFDDQKIQKEFIEIVIKGYCNPKMGK